MGQRQLFTYISLAIIFLAVPITLVILQQRTQLFSEAYVYDKTVQPPDTSPEFEVCGVQVSRVAPLGEPQDPNSGYSEYDPEKGVYTITFKVTNLNNETVKIRSIYNRCRCREGEGQYGPDVVPPADVEWQVCKDYWPEQRKDPNDPSLPYCDEQNENFELAPQEDIDKIVKVTTNRPSSIFNVAEPNCGSFQADWIMREVIYEDGSTCDALREQDRPQPGNDKVLFAAYGLNFTGKDLPPGSMDCAICPVTTTSQVEDINNKGVPLQINQNEYLLETRDITDKGPLPLQSLDLYNEERQGYAERKLKQEFTFEDSIDNKEDTLKKIPDGKKILERFCIDNAGKGGCPDNLKGDQVIDPTDTDTIENFTFACGSDITYGWRVEGPTTKPLVCTITSNPDPAQGLQGLGVTFDGSGSTGKSGTADDLTYSWNVNDNPPVTGTNSTLTNVFNNVGSFTTSLTITDATDNSTKTCTVPVTITATPKQPPICDLVASPTQGNIPLTVNFSDGTSSDPDGQIVGWSWILGDGSTSNQESFSHVYTGSGPYTATVQVIDNDGLRSTLCTKTITTTKETVSHLACEGLACVSVEGPGKDLCQSKDDCVVSVCTTQNTCEARAVSDVTTGDIACTGDTDCNVRNVCQNFSCVQERGPGGDECTSDPDCLETYLTCESFSCVEKVGNKEDTCALDEDCYKNICDASDACVQIAVLEDGPDECAGDTDCAQPTHLACTDTSCQIVEGAGVDQCATDNDCQRNICNESEACVTVADVSGQADQCLTDGDCALPTHLACADTSCQIVEGAGVDQCTTDNDCQRNICNEFDACVTLADQSGQADQCSTDGDCVEPTHLECIGESCSITAGEGVDQCSTNADCAVVVQQSTYNTCLNQTCVVMAGVPPDGTQLCDTDAECKLPTIPQREEPVPTTGVEKGALAITLGAVALLLFGLRLFL